MLRSCRCIRSGPKLYRTHRNNLFFTAGLLARSLTFKLERNPLSAVRDCLFNTLSFSPSLETYTQLSTWGQAMPLWQRKHLTCRQWTLVNRISIIICRVEDGGNVDVFKWDSLGLNAPMRMCGLLLFRTRRRNAVHLCVTVLWESLIAKTVRIVEMATPAYFEDIKLHCYLMCATACSKHYRAV
jgi:hypothetical protein